MGSSNSHYRYVFYAYAPDGKWFLYNTEKPASTDTEVDQLIAGIKISRPSAVKVRILKLTEKLEHPPEMTDNSFFISLTRCCLKTRDLTRRPVPEDTYLKIQL